MYEVLPRVPWLQKEHFIIAAPKCSLKPLSKSLTVVFQTDMSVHRSKKRENVSKGKIPSDTLICTICLGVRSQKHPRTREVTGTESYFDFENFLM